MQNSNVMRNHNDSYSKHISGDKQRQRTPEFGSTYKNDFEIQSEVPKSKIFTQNYQ